MILILLLIKHYIADFLLQSDWMAYGKGKLTNWFIPLLSHCLIHGVLTFCVIIIFYSLPIALLYGIIDTVIHFIIDRIKAHPKLGGRWNPNERNFWLALGADQLAHNLTYVVIYLSL